MQVILNARFMSSLVHTLILPTGWIHGRMGSSFSSEVHPFRTICRASSVNGISIPMKAGWLRDAAEGYQHFHARDVIHGDVGSDNLILVWEDHVKLIGFEGCSVDRGPAGACYEWFSYCPSIPRVSRRIDIFAFGCTVYEVLTGRPPCFEFETSDDPSRHIEEL